MEAQQYIAPNRISEELARREIHSTERNSRSAFFFFRINSSKMQSENIKGEQEKLSCQSGCTGTFFLKKITGAEFSRDFSSSGSFLTATRRKRQTCGTSDGIRSARCFTLSKKLHRLVVENSCKISCCAMFTIALAALSYLGLVEWPFSL